jgi:hypothetical protein
MTDTDTIAMIVGMTFVSVIIICLVFTVGSYIIEDVKLKRKQ